MPELKDILLFEILKQKIKDNVIEAHKVEYFKEYQEEPTATQMMVVEKVLNEEMDEYINLHVKNHLQELISTAKDIKGRGFNIRDKVLSGVIIALISIGILWRLSENDFYTAILLGITLFALSIILLKK